MRVLWWLQRNVQFCCVLLTIAVVLLLGSIDGQHQHHQLHVVQATTETPVLQAAHQQHQQNKEQQHFQQLHQQHQMQRQQQQQQQQQHQQQQHQPLQQQQQQLHSQMHAQQQHQQHQQHQQQQHHQQQQQQSQLHQHPHHLPVSGGHGSGGHNMYAMLSQAMSEAVSHEYTGSTGSGAAPDGTCLADDLECLNNVHDRLGMEAIRSLHQQLDDDDNGNIDLTESDDFLREELKYDSGYEKRHKTFHYNDDTQISVKELWEAWLRSEVHNWTMEQTTDWLAQSVQLPQYVELFQKHKVSGATLPRLAVHNMHYVSTVLGIRDPIHKQKIALKAMDVVLFGPPRETGNRWKDYFLVTLLLGAIIGCWYAYQQNKNAKRHLRRMAKDMEGLLRAENALTDMQKELELARLEQENVATEKLDLERRLREAPSLSSSSSDLELQQLKQEVEMLRAELSRAEVELVDHCWTPPPALQSWLQLTFELESKHTLKQRVAAEKQLQLAREACEKLKKKRSSLVGSFVSTHGKSMDDVDRSIVVARNALSEVTTEMQERMHRWKQIESMMGFSILNNNGLAYLESVLYSRNGSGKSSRNRISGSQDELDDESSVQDSHGSGATHARLYRDDSSGSDDGDTVTFILGDANATSTSTMASSAGVGTSGGGIPVANVALHGRLHNYSSLSLASVPPSSAASQQQHLHGSGLAAAVTYAHQNHHGDSSYLDEARSLDRIMPLPRTKKPIVNSASSTTSIHTTIAAGHQPPPSSSQGNSPTSSSNQYAASPSPRDPIFAVGDPVEAIGSAQPPPMPPPRRAASQQSFTSYIGSLHRTVSTDVESVESDAPATGGHHQHHAQQQHQQQSAVNSAAAAAAASAAGLRDESNWRQLQRQPSVQQSVPQSQQHQHQQQHEQQLQQHPSTNISNASNTSGSRGSLRSSVFSTSVDVDNNSTSTTTTTDSSSVDGSGGGMRGGSAAAAAAASVAGGQRPSDGPAGAAVAGGVEEPKKRRRKLQFLFGRRSKKSSSSSSAGTPHHSSASGGGDQQ